MGRVSHPTQNFGWAGHNTFGCTNNWPVCSLILRKISKIGATYRCQILRLKCTKFVVRCFAPDSAGETKELAALLRSLFKKPAPNGRERNGRGKKGEGKER